MEDYPAGEWIPFCKRRLVVIVLISQKRGKRNEKMMRAPGLYERSRDWQLATAVSKKVDGRSQRPTN